MAKAVKWVLVVEDETDLRDLIVSFLELQFGDKVKIVSVPDGVEATSKIRFQAYDCIVTDLRMPRKEGRAFVESAHQSALNEHTPIILHTGFPDLELLRRFPLCTLLEKPVPPEKIADLVATQLKLGRTDRRVGASVLNNIVEAAHQMLAKMIHERGELMPPRVKRVGEPFSDAVIRLVSCKLGAQVVDFAFAIPEPLLHEMGRVSSRGGEHPSADKLILVASNILLKHSMDSADGSGTVTIVKSQVFSGAESERAVLNGKKGIAMGVGTKLGVMEIFAIV